MDECSPVLEDVISMVISAKVDIIGRQNPRLLPYCLTTADKEPRLAKSLSYHPLAQEADATCIVLDVTYVCKLVIAKTRKTRCSMNPTVK